MSRRRGLFGSVATCSWYLAWLGLVLLAGAGVLLWHLQAHGVAVRLIVVEQLADVAAQPFEVQDSDLLAREFSGKDSVELLRAVMNGVTRVGPDPPGGVRQFLEHAKAGGGLVCFGMAHLYAAAASGNGLQARIIGLSRNLGDRYDAHTTVEVRQEGRWVLFDPTFNVSFARDGILLGAEEIQRAFLDGTFQAIVPVFYGPVRYPARLEVGSLPWLPLFNNIFVLDAQRGVLAKLPPLRYWLGPRIYVKTLPGHPNEHVRFVNTLYWVASAFLPLLGLAILVLGALGWWAGRRVAAIGAPDGKDQRADASAG
jgi:hypothetical protein